MRVCVCVCVCGDGECVCDDRPLRTTQKLFALWIHAEMRNKRSAELFQEVQLLR